MTSTIDNAVVATLADRHARGESLPSLAREVGVSWQKLWGLVRGPSAPPPLPGRPLEARPGAASLVERYRPITLDGLWGQDRAVKVLKSFAAAPCPASFIFEGGTGAGKTSAALALAQALGCDVASGEWGGVWEIASGEQTADAVRETGRRMGLHPGSGSGWRVVIVNEADRMCRPAEVIWLDLLEHLPRKAVVVFTTNDPGLLSQRFRDRSTTLCFESRADVLRPAMIAFAAAVWKTETGRPAARRQITALVEQAVVKGELSFRRVVQVLARTLAEAGA